MEMIRLQGRTLSDDDLKTVRALIDEYPQCNRTALSVRLCQLWNWRNEVGRPKDMAARTLLLKLQARGWIRLPHSSSPSLRSKKDARAGEARAAATAADRLTATHPRASTTNPMFESWRAHRSLSKAQRSPAHGAEFCSAPLTKTPRDSNRVRQKLPRATDGVPAPLQ